MGTNIRRNLSAKNRYYLTKHRRLELEHFCLQYHEWERELQSLNMLPEITYQDVNAYDKSDPTVKMAIRAFELNEKIKMVKETARLCDPEIGNFIFAAVTTGKTFSYFEAHGIPCGRDMFYDRLRKFYYLLDKTRK